MILAGMLLLFISKGSADANSSKLIKELIMNFQNEEINLRTFRSQVDQFTEDELKDLFHLIIEGKAAQVTIDFEEEILSNFRASFLDCAMDKTNFVYKFTPNLLPVTLTSCILMKKLINQ
ncbi:MAG: hypothetical protein MHMPM18_004366 [Marteilia pararefringens]